MSTLGGRALKRILNFNCLCNNYSIQLAHVPQCTASPSCNTVVNIPIDSCRICHGIGQNYTLLLFHLYYTGEKECGVHSSFPLYTCIYWEQTVWAHSFPPIYIQERKNVPTLFPPLYIYRQYQTVSLDFSCMNEKKSQQ